MPLIFISYRRDDTLSATGRLTETLEARFGANEIFRDLDEIEAGADFRDALLDALRASRAMLVVIGRSWSTLTDSSGTPRLQDPGDYLRIEIETALAHKLLVIPVLVEGAQMPAPHDLPPSLEGLTYHNAHEISESRWRYDTDQLIALLERKLGIEAKSVSGAAHSTRPGAAAIAAVTHVPGDLLSLLYEPRRFLADRAFGSRRDLFRAVIFLVVSQAVGAGIILQEWPTRSSVVQFLLTPSLLWLLFAGVFSLPLYLSWRVAGAPREYQRVLIILLYQCAFVGLSLSVAILMTLGGVAITQPQALVDFASDMTVEGMQRLMAAIESAYAVSLTIASGMSVLIVLALAIWLVITWGAYRDALHLSRARSLMAGAVLASFGVIPVALVAWVASLMSN